MAQVIYNGEWIEATVPVFTAAHPAAKWGAGVFETIRVHKGVMPLFSYHITRLRSSMQWLSLRAPEELEAAALQENIARLCSANGTGGDARVRLGVFEDAENKTGYCIEALPYTPAAGIVRFPVIEYPYYRKASGAFSKLKSISYLPFLLARRYAEDRSAGECIIFNAHDRAVEGSHTNLFLVSDRIIYTPPVEEGCVDGVMRKYVLEQLEEKGAEVQIVPVTRGMLHTADEIFFTNALAGLRSAASWEGRALGSDFTDALYRDIIKALWA